jgi:hypothetical protein
MIKLQTNKLTGPEEIIAPSCNLWVPCLICFRYIETFVLALNCAAGTISIHHQHVDAFDRRLSVMFHALPAVVWVMASVKLSAYI